MKIAKRDIALVMVIVALIAAFCAYKFSLSVNLDKVDEEETKQAALQVQIDEVKARANEVQKMDREIAEWQTNIANWIKPFHAGYLYEDGIMYLNNLENQDEEGGDTAFDVRIASYTVGETSISKTVSGQGSFAGTEYRSGTTAYNFSYSIHDYAELKNFINYMVSEKDGSGVKSLDTMSFVVNLDDETYEGSVTMTAYSIIDLPETTNPYKPQDLENVEQRIEVETIWGDVEKNEKDNK